MNISKCNVMHRFPKIWANWFANYEGRVETAQDRWRGKEVKLYGGNLLEPIINVNILKDV